MADLLTLTTFTSLLGQKFQVSCANHDKQELELIEANSVPSRGDAPRQDPFSLEFRASRDCGLWQGTVELEHESIGSTDLFLVPVGKDEKGMYFQALFN